MHKVLLVTTNIDTKPIGGREKLLQLNRDILFNIFRHNLTVVNLDKSKSITNKIMNKIIGYIDGLTYSVCEEIIDLIKKNSISSVFLDGSNLGLLAKKIKKFFPTIEVSVFFHNIESRFFFGSLRSKKNLHSIGVLIANYLAERKAVHYSDKRVCMNERDSLLMKRVYGRKATHISPMALEDKIPIDLISSSNKDKEPYLLFVGSTFYANQKGITWFVKHVVPRINIKVCIVGQGFELLRSKLEIPGKVEVIGSVDNLTEWYQQALFIVAPIFDGSGMKTKVAEALMHGKKVAGTPEAFSGYENIIKHAGWVCKTKEEFIKVITYAQNELKLEFNPSLRLIYQNTYSFSAALIRMKVIMEN